jgi:hypothetical protein
MEWLASDNIYERKKCIEFIKFWLDSITVYTYDESKGVSASIVIIGTRRDKVSSPVMHERINTLLCETFQTKVAWRSIIENTKGNKVNRTYSFLYFVIYISTFNHRDRIERYLHTMFFPN